MADAEHRKAFAAIYQALQPPDPDRDTWPAEIKRLREQIAALTAGRDALRALLKEAREDWIKVGYGASHEDVAECREFCDRIDAAIDAARKETP